MCARFLAGKEYFVLLPISLSWFSLYGFMLKAFRGFPKGVDAYAHLTMTKFILDNWPHIRWNPYWYGGLPYYLWYAPVPHLLTASAVGITGWTPEVAMVFIVLFASLVTATSLFLFVQEATKNYYIATMVLLLFTMSPVYWGWIISGGAYARTVSFMWLPISSWLTLKWLRHRTRTSYLLAALTTSIGLVSHLQVGLFTVATVFFLIYFSSGGNLFVRLKQAGKIVAPALLLSSFFYVPFVASKPSQFFGKPHVPGPVDIYSVVDPTNWNIIPFYMLLFGIVILILLRTRQSRKSPPATVALTKTCKAISVILFIYAFTSLIPPDYYVFSPYDCPFYISLYVSIAIGALLAKVEKTIIRRAVGTVVALILVISFIQYPILQSHVWDSGIESWHNGYYVAQQLVKLPNDPNFRFGADWDGATSWFNYKYRIPQFLGFYSIDLAPRANWNHILLDNVWKREDDLEVTNHLLDWYAIKWLMVGFPRYRYQKFLDSPNEHALVSTVDTPTMYTMYLFEYKKVSPIVSPTNATTVLVIGDEHYYRNLFLLLSLSGCSSRHVVPIYGRSSDMDPEQLENFDTVIVHSDDSRLTDENLWESLAEFVDRGGGLIIDGSIIGVRDVPHPSPVERTMISSPSEPKWNFTSLDETVLDYVNLMTVPLQTEFSSTADEHMRQWSRTVLEHDESPIIVAGQYGAGRVVWCGLDLVNLSWQERSLSSSQILSRLIEWTSARPNRMMQVFPIYEAGDITHWKVSWSTMNASGQIAPDVVEGKTRPKLVYIFGGAHHENQVNYLYDPPGVWNFSRSDLFGLYLYGDGSSHKITIYLESDDYKHSYWFEFYLDWRGWRRMVYPFSTMNIYGNPNIAAINKIDIVINDDPDAFSSEPRGSLYIDNVFTVVRVDSVNEHRYLVERPNPEKVIVHTNASADGILFKESYFENWNAYSSGANGSRYDLHIHKAGPDFMYVRIPRGTEFPAKIVFEYGSTETEWLGHLITILTLAVLLAYGIGLPINRLTKPITRRLHSSGRQWKP